MMKLFKNQMGSALLPVLIVAASAIAGALIILQNSSSISQLYARKATATIVDNVSQLIGSVVSDPNVCFGGFNQISIGAKFLPAAAGTRGTFTAVAPASSQDVSIPDPTGGIFQNNYVIPNTPIKIKRLYITNAQPIALVPNAYKADLMATFQSTAASAEGYSARKVATMEIKTNGAGGITGCGATVGTSNQELCEGMNCTYTVSSSGVGNCDCPIKPVTCLNGQYVTSITALTPQCSTGPILTRTCAPGSKRFLVALDSAGAPVCATVDPCPAGTTGTGAGGAASPASCKCNNAGETWDVPTSTCIVAGPVVNGLCGTPPNGGSYATVAAANAAGAKCSAGTSSVASFSGAGPWNWTCVGSGTGHTDASCSASQTSSATPLCSDGVTPDCMSWVSNMGSPPIPCSPFLNPSPPPGCYAGNNCNHMPNGYTCAYGGFAQTCVSSCPVGPSCPTGSSATGVGVTVAPGCKCNNASDSYDGTSCGPYTSDCQYSFNTNTLVSSICGPSDSIPSALGGTCNSPRYVELAAPPQTCNGYTAVLCPACGPGSNPSAGICTQDPSCGFGPPVTDCGTGFGNPGWTGIGGATVGRGTAIYTDARFQGAWSQWTNGSSSGPAWQTMGGGQQTSATWSQDSSGTWVGVIAVSPGASHYSSGEFYMGGATNNHCTSAINGKYGFFAAIDAGGASSFQWWYQCNCP